jgi:hypothetical protein
VWGTYKLKRAEIKTGQGVERKQDSEGHLLAREGGGKD